MSVSNPSRLRDLFDCISYFKVQHSVFPLQYLYVCSFLPGCPVLSCQVFQQLRWAVWTPGPLLPTMLKADGPLGLPGLHTALQGIPPSLLQVAFPRNGTLIFANHASTHRTPVSPGFTIRSTKSSPRWHPAPRLPQAQTWSVPACSSP